MGGRYRVLWSPWAEGDLLEAARGVALHSMEAAERLLDEFDRKTWSLGRLPGRCRRVPELREVVDWRETLVGRHRVVFRIEEERRRVEILMVLHAARDARDLLLERFSRLE